MKTKDVIKYFGDASTLAKCLGISPQAVYNWPELVPRRWAYEIHFRTDGLISFDPSLHPDTKNLTRYNMRAFVQKYKSTNEQK